MISCPARGLMTGMTRLKACVVAAEMHELCCSALLWSHASSCGLWPLIDRDGIPPCRQLRRVIVTGQAGCAQLLRHTAAVPWGSGHLMLHRSGTKEGSMSKRGVIVI